ncbi:serine protease grass [Drosophila gunungcola]|uniref:Peptidase S1 domain-containing protein n=1 Tax=Drosophila gunungcola TaxID=103775 RepID=A0A9Q0BM00_9MUSC|nr:serine protease grass [Drosophila gunungcola]KAI8036349.1 hypothetical protein M5D96_010942 [Drosophila gunungcola]
MICRELKRVFVGVAVISCLWLQVQGSDSILLEENCGVVHQFAQRIVNGVPAGLGAYPWMAFLHTPTHFKCAGSLINNRFVLTAAHCLKDALELIVRLGEHNRDTRIDCGNHYCQDAAQEFGVIWAIKHKLYNEEDLSHDIAVLMVDRNVEYLPHIRPICIFLDERVKTQVDGFKWFTASGWGLTSGEPNAQTSRILRELRINRRPTEDCIRALSHRLIPEQICAGNDASNLCRGDSGGPQGRIFKYNGIERFTQLGIASYTTPGCVNVSVLTDVISYGKWIKRVVKHYTQKNEM